MISTYVSGRNMNVGDALTNYVNVHISRIESKYFGEFIASRVVFKKESRGIKFMCNIRLTCSRGVVYTSNSEHQSVYISFNRAATQISAQMRRTKTELHDDKPINVVKSKTFVEHNKSVGILDDDEIEVINVPALYGHKE